MQQKNLVDFSREVDEILFPSKHAGNLLRHKRHGGQNRFLICMSVLRVVHGIMSHGRNYYGICTNHELDNTHCTIDVKIFLPFKFRLLACF